MTVYICFKVMSTNNHTYMSVNPQHSLTSDHINASYKTYTQADSKDTSVCGNDDSNKNLYTLLDSLATNPLPGKTQFDPFNDLKEAHKKFGNLLNEESDSGIFTNEKDLGIALLTTYICRLEAREAVLAHLGEGVADSNLGRVSVLYEDISTSPTSDIQNEIAVCKALLTEVRAGKKKLKSKVVLQKEGLYKTWIKDGDKYGDTFKSEQLASYITEGVSTTLSPEAFPGTHQLRDASTPFRNMISPPRKGSLPHSVLFSDLSQILSPLTTAPPPFSLGDLTNVSSLMSLNNDDYDALDKQLRENDTAFKKALVLIHSLESSASSSGRLEGGEGAGTMATNSRQVQLEIVKTNKAEFTQGFKQQLQFLQTQVPGVRVPEIEWLEGKFDLQMRTQAAAIELLGRTATEAQSSSHQLQEAITGKLTKLQATLTEVAQLIEKYRMNDSNGGVMSLEAELRASPDVDGSSPSTVPLLHSFDEVSSVSASEGMQFSGSLLSDDQSPCEFIRGKLMHAKADIVAIEMLRSTISDTVRNEILEELKQEWIALQEKFIELFNLSSVDPRVAELIKQVREFRGLEAALLDQEDVLVTQNGVIDRLKAEKELLSEELTKAYTELNRSVTSLSQAGLNVTKVSDTSIDSSTTALEFDRDELERQVEKLREVKRGLQLDIFQERHGHPNSSMDLSEPTEVRVAPRNETLRAQNTALLEKVKVLHEEIELCCLQRRNDIARISELETQLGRLGAPTPVRPANPTPGRARGLASSSSFISDV